MVREISVEEFAALYHGYIIDDFPRSERRPLYAIRSLYKKNRYSCLVMEDAGKITAYACFIRDASCPYMLLDYFAVAKDLRGTGIGSQFIGQIKTCRCIDGILIESDMPLPDNSPEEHAVRERRIRFYVRNGAELSDYGWQAFGVKYNLLWLPVKKKLYEVNVGEGIERIYSLTMPDALRRNMTRLYRIQS